MLPIVRRRVPRTVPEILNRIEAEVLLGAIRSPKIRAVSMVMYGSGLRVSEACALRFDDLDAQRGVLRVRESKGGHSRYALLSTSLVRALRAYYRKTRPPGPLLFPGQHDTSRPITREAIHWGLSEAVMATKLSKRISPHSLRHYAGCRFMPGGVRERVAETPADPN